jgi:hypothetical protein
MSDDESKVKITPEFEESVKKWVMLDNQIKQAQDVSKTWKEERDKIGEFMTVYMKKEKLEQSVINLSDGKLKLAQRTYSTPMSKDYMIKRLTLYFKGNPEKAMDCVNFMYEDREKKIAETISRTRNRT